MLDYIKIIAQLPIISLLLRAPHILWRFFSKISLAYLTLNAYKENII